jgi:hypothetical protein
VPAVPQSDGEGATVRHARKVDLLHGPIRDALKRVTHVLDTSHIGGGFVDMLALHVHTGQVKYIEVKTTDGKRNPKPRKFTKAQLVMREWLEFNVVTTVEEALRVVGIETCK